MSGTSNGSGGQAQNGGGGPNPGGIRPADPPARPPSLTVDAGLEEMKRSRERAAKPQRAAPPAGRQAEPPAAGEHQAQLGDEGEGGGEEQQQQQEGGGEEQQQNGGDGAEPRFQVQGVGEVGIGELVQGYLRQADYTTKTQAAAAQQQQMQQAHQAFSQMRDQLHARLAQVTQDMGQEFDKPVDWVKLAKEDPLGYQEKHARFTALQDARREQGELAAQAAREQHATKTRILAAANEFLGRTLPSWKEQAKRAELLGEIRDYARSRGYSDQELDAQEVLDPRQILVLHDAMQYRKIAGRRVVPQPNNSGGTPPRGTSPQPQAGKRENELRQNFEQDRSLRSATALVSALRHRPPGRR